MIAGAFRERDSRVAVGSGKIYVYAAAFRLFDKLLSFHSDVIRVLVGLCNKAVAQGCVRNHLLFCLFIILAVHKSPYSGETDKGIHEHLCIDRLLQLFNHRSEISVNRFFCAFAVFFNNVLTKAEKLIGKIAFYQVFFNTVKNRIKFNFNISRKKLSDYIRSENSR